MKLRQLEALQAVAEMGSLQEAARRLFVTQPAISRSIRELEGELGISLLVRSARGATLTPYAVGVLKRARAIRREVQRIVEDVEAIRGALNGQLTLAMTPPASSRALAETLAEFTRHHPDAKLHVLEWRAEQIIEGLRDGTVDVGLLSQYCDPQTSSFEWQRLYELDTLLTISGTYNGPTTLTVEQLHELPWLVLDSIDDPSSFIVTLFTSYGMPLPKQIIRCSSMNLYGELSMRIPAVSIWTAPVLPILAPRFKEGKLKQLHLHGGTPSIGMYLAYPSEDLLTATARDFVIRLTTKLGRSDIPGQFPLGKSPAGIWWSVPHRDEPS
ncbi:LysR family transcriptional regulator [Burkholderia contaminans]|nr:LysR family transcriptional regulator [Burkholderia contaminans]